MALIDFTTSEVHPRERLSYWVEVATRSFAAHDFAPGEGNSFQGNLRANLVGSLLVSKYDCTPCHAYRNEQHIRRCDRGDDFLLMLQIAGEGYISQNGREEILTPGRFSLLDIAQPYHVSHADVASAIVLKLPKRDLEARLGPAGSYLARSLSSETSASNLATGFIRMLEQNADGLAREAADTIAKTTLDLITLALSEMQMENGAHLTSARVDALVRLKAAIETRLSDPELKPEVAAAAAGISVRYANVLLQEEDLSLGRYILLRRLERCRAALISPQNLHRTTSEIAFSWGFSDISHFGRRFKDVYGQAPSDYRRAVVMKSEPPLSR